MCRRETPLSSGLRDGTGSSRWLAREQVCAAYVEIPADDVFGAGPPKQSKYASTRASTKPVSLARVAGELAWARGDLAAAERSLRDSIAQWLQVSAPLVRRCLALRETFPAR